MSDASSLGREEYGVRSGRVQLGYQGSVVLPCQRELVMPLPVSRACPNSSGENMSVTLGQLSLCSQLLLVLSATSLHASAGLLHGRDFPRLRKM